MKTILIIEHDVVELETLMDRCRLGPEELVVLSAQDEKSAHTILSEKRVDLIICSTVFPDRPDCLVLIRIARAFPYIPLIAIAPAGTVAGDKVLSFGASAFLERPLRDESLIEQVSRLAERSSSGTVRDIPVHSFLQMIETEKKTCTLEVFSDNDGGLIFIKEGNLIGAETGSVADEEAIYEIISWNEVIIEVRFFNGQRETKITKPLISLIMEGFRLKDEKETRKKQEQTISHHHQKLKQVSTTGHRLALDIGLRLRLEFDTMDSGLDSVLIGMIPEKCIIAATPSHFIITRTVPPVGSIILVKYMYMGELCLFKSKVLKTLDSPQHMVFLDYPAVIHFHEMRKAKRAAIYVPCTLNSADARNYFGAFIDLSGSGGLCQIKIDGNKELPEIQVGQEIGLSCLLPGLAEEQQLVGVARNVKKNSRKIRIGIEFSRLSDHIKSAIEQYLFTAEHYDASHRLAEN